MPFKIEITNNASDELNIEEALQTAYSAVYLNPDKRSEARKALHAGQTYSYSHGDSKVTITINPSA
jgi:hypothetical protein